MQTGGPSDPYLSLRIGIAAAVAVFSLMLSPLPRLRSILVRLGTLAMAVMQGQGLIPVVQSVVLDPSLIGALAPNLAAQATGMLALLQLFIVARARPSSISGLFFRGQANHCETGIEAISADWGFRVASLLARRPQVSSPAA